MKCRGGLLCFLVCSLILHVVVIYCLDFNKSGPFGVSSAKQISVRIRGARQLSSVVKGNNAITAVRRETNLPGEHPKTSESVGAQDDDHIEPAPGSDYGPHIVLGSESLDQPLTLVDELDLDAGLSYPEELEGSLTLNVLVGDDGLVRWASAEASDLDPDVIIQLVQKFQGAHFTSPVANGKPAWVLLRIEVSIGRQGQ